MDKILSILCKTGRCFRKMLGPKAQIQKCWQALIIRGGSVGIKDYGYIILSDEL